MSTCSGIATTLSLSILFQPPLYTQTKAKEQHLCTHAWNITRLAHVYEVGKTLACKQLDGAAAHPCSPSPWLPCCDWSISMDISISWPSPSPAWVSIPSFRASSISSGDISCRSITHNLSHLAAHVDASGVRISHAVISMQGEAQTPTACRRQECYY